MDNTDAELCDALKMVNLAKLIGGNGSMTVDDWRKRLSNGEKQRLAMARLILQKPTMAFLDEATSALDPENERLLYETLRTQKSTFVSVGHKKDLLKFHTHVLELAPGGLWRVVPAKHFQFGEWNPVIEEPTPGSYDCLTIMGEPMDSSFSDFTPFSG